ncbi:hypothetical protein Ancab_008494 [Ancistrocladus abbreviatus]
MIAGSSSEDDVEWPVFNDEGDMDCQTKDLGYSTYSLKEASMCRLDEELISDDEIQGSHAPFHSSTSGVKGSGSIDLHKILKGKELQASMWSAVHKEANGPLHLDKNARNSSEHAAYSKQHSYAKGRRGKIKSRSLFHFQSHKKEYVCQSIQEDVGFDSSKAHLVDEWKTIECQSLDPSSSDLVDSFQDEKIRELDNVVPTEVVSKHVCTKHSMSELLDDLRGKDGYLHATSKMYVRTKGRRVELSTNKNVSVLGERGINYEDHCKDMPSASSSDDEAGGHNINLIIVEAKKRTIVDQFEEALVAAGEDDEGALIAVPRQSDIGLFRKLQRVMQWEKEQDLEFLRMLEAGFNDQARCMEVKILSRSFDAKLTVCRCITWNNKSYRCTENCQEENLGKASTIIFNSRVCGDVELEEGNLIRVHAPWKEVEVFEGSETIILATYFSHILT